MSYISHVDYKKMMDGFKKGAPKKMLKESLDPVGKEDADINNDGKADKTDKYLAKRRKAISQNVDETHLNWPPTSDHEATMAMGELRSMVKNSIIITVY